MTTSGTPTADLPDRWRAHAWAEYARGRADLAALLWACANDLDEETQRMDWNTLTADENHWMTLHYTPGRAGHRIDKTVIHHNGGRLTLRGCYDVWQTRKASAHYQVDAHGRIGQYVHDRDTAWHAANTLANRTSIGIEHANAGDATTPVTAATLDAGAHLVAALHHAYGLGRPEWMVNVFPHNHFTATGCPGHLAGSQNAQYMARAQAHYDAIGAATTTPGDDDMAMTDADRKAFAREIGQEVAAALLSAPIGKGAADAPADLGWGLYRIQSELMRLGKVAATLKPASDKASQ